MPSSLIESIVSLEVGAQEPWPNDVKLYQPYAIEQILLPDNANCLAVQAFLHMCGLPFQIEHRSNAEFMSPSGKVPFIKCGAFVVSELEPIVQFVANKGITLTEDLDAEEKSDMRAYMSIIHTVLMNAELYLCWCDNKTYNEVTKVRNGSVYPWPLNYFQTWSKRSAVVKKLKVLGWYQKSLDSVYQEVENCCQALSERLEGKEYFFGSKPTEIDALLFGHTFAILSNPAYCSKLIFALIQFPNLILHCKRICINYMTHQGLNCSELIDQPIFKPVFPCESSVITDAVKIETCMKYLKFLSGESDESSINMYGRSDTEVADLNLEEINFNSFKDSTSSDSILNVDVIKRTESKIDCSVLQMADNLDFDDILTLENIKSSSSSIKPLDLQETKCNAVTNIPCNLIFSHTTLKKSNTSIRNICSSDSFLADVVSHKYSDISLSFTFSNESVEVKNTAKENIELRASQSHTSFIDIFVKKSISDLSS